MNENRPDYTIEMKYTDAFGWALVCEHLTIDVDALSEKEVIDVLKAIVMLLGALYP